MILDDLVPINHTFEGNEGITIYPISDLHIGSRETDLKKWKEFKKFIVNQPNSYITIGGDMMNNGLKSSVTNIYEELMPPNQQADYLYETLYDIKDKILAIVPGNHEYRSIKESDTHLLYNLALELGIPELYRENTAFISIRLGDRLTRGNKNPSYNIVLVHGVGGGKKTGSGINRYEDFAGSFEGLDILLAGHTHKPFVTKPEKTIIDSRNGHIIQKTTTVVVTTAWLKYGGYGMRALFNACSISLPKIFLYGTKKEVKVEI